MKVMRYELYKLFHRRMILIFLIFGLLWVAAGVIFPAFQYETYTEDMEPLRGLSAIKYDRELQNTYAGRLTLDELESLWRECHLIQIISGKMGSSRVKATQRRLPSRHIGNIYAALALYQQSVQKRIYRPSILMTQETAAI